MLIDKVIEKKVNDILIKMTTEQKIGQLTQMCWSGALSSEERNNKLLDLIRDGKIGSVILAVNAYAGSDETTFSDRDFIDEMQRVATEESSTGIPLLIGRDVIHGHHVVYPIPLALSASFNFELIREAYQNIADEALSYGINWTYAPMLDVSRDPRWGRIIESPGEDPYLGEQMAKAVVMGVQGDELPIKMAACAKHYIGYGASEGGRDYNNVDISDYTLRNYYLKAFKSAVDAGVLTFMSSFNEVGGQPTTSNRYLLTDILRGELGFDGFVISDWGAVAQLIKQGVAEDKREAAMLAINAGLDVEMCDSCYCDNLENLLENNEVSMATLDEAVLRVLKVKLALDLFNNPYTKKTVPEIQKHMEHAREMSRECIVLLKNKEDILPLDKTEMIAVAGPMLHNQRAILGSWTLDGDESLAVTIFEGLKKVNSHIFELDNFASAGNHRPDFAKCKTVILALGESHEVTGEARSLSDISLAEEQKILIKKMKKLGKRVVAVISAGRPLALEDVEDYIDALVYVWHGGTQTGNAAADIIFGDYSPSGRLPVTFPRVVGQIPIYYNFPPAGRDVNGYYEKDRVMVNYEDSKDSPLYPFGYGLSYTSFEYSDITVEKSSYSVEDLDKGIQVSVNVRNSGKYAAKEVVQCYIRDRKSSMTRPMKELKSTQKIDITAGEEKKIGFILEKSDFSFYNAGGQFVFEPGEFDIFIGENSLTERKVTISIG